MSRYSGPQGKGAAEAEARDALTRRGGVMTWLKIAAGWLVLRAVEGIAWAIVWFDRKQVRS